MNHLMLFETFLGPLHVTILQGFEHENEKYFAAAKQLAVESVSDYIDIPNVEYHIQQDIENNADRHLSIFAIDSEKNVVGVVFLKAESIFTALEKHKNHGFEIEEKIDLTKYRDKKGLHGFLFAVKKSDRKSYVAWMLMHEVLKRFKNQFDYFFGIQAEVFKSNIKYDKRATLAAVMLPMGLYKHGYFYLRDL